MKLERLPRGERVEDSGIRASHLIDPIRLRCTWPDRPLSSPVKETGEDKIENQAASLSNTSSKFAGSVGLLKTPKAPFSRALSSKSLAA